VFRFSVLCPLRSLATRSLPLILPLLLLACAQAQQQNTGTIVGQLRVPRASFPPIRVLVTLERSGAQAGTEYCDGEGRFSFQDLPGNLYHIVIQQEGFLPINVPVALNPTVQHVLYVQIELIPEEQKVDSGAKLTGSNPAMVDQSALLDNFPKDARNHYKKATKLRDEGKPREAIQHYQKALTIAPTMYFARNNLGSLYLENKWFPEAEAEFRKVIAENQADANAYFNLGNVCLLTKRFDQATDFIQQGLTRQPKSALGHFLMGSVMLQKGQHASAEQHLRSALTENPGLASAHLALVNIYMQQRRTPDAVRELAAFLKQSPDSSFAPQARQLLIKLQSPSRMQP
jgi:tetratricopeptide (TPR) repeat protein